jgi:hypothetical protein
VIRDNFVITGITPVNGANGLAAPDPTIQVSIGYPGYYDGNSTNADLALPVDLVVPLKVWERLNGSTDSFQEVREAQNGIGQGQQTTYQGQWEWREDQIFMPGSLQTEDIQLRYVCALPLLAPPDDGSLDLSEIAVPIADCENALALKLARSYGFARGSDQVQIADAMAKEAVRLLQNRYIRAQQAIDYHAQSYGPTSKLWPLA